MRVNTYPVSLHRLRGEVCGDLLKLLQGSPQVFQYLFSDDTRRRKVGSVLDALVAQPEDVEVYLVSLDQLVILETTEPFCFLARLSGLQG